MTQAGTSFYTRQTYFPYGAQRTTEGSALPTDYTFTGQKNDDSTGLMFYGARYYDAALGRFTQPDTIVPSPLNPQSLNRFAYVLNNPVRYVDPSGHMEVDPTEGTGGGNGDPNDTDLEKTIEVIMPNPNGGEPMGVTLYVPFCDRHPEANRCGDNQTGAKTGKNQGPEKLPVAIR